VFSGHAAVVRQRRLRFCCHCHYGRRRTCPSENILQPESLKLKCSKTLPRIRQSGVLFLIVVVWLWCVNSQTRLDLLFPILRMSPRCPIGLQPHVQTRAGGRLLRHDTLGAEMQGMKGMQGTRVCGTNERNCITQMSCISCIFPCRPTHPTLPKPGRAAKIPSIFIWVARDCPGRPACSIFCLLGLPSRHKGATAVDREPVRLHQRVKPPASALTTLLYA
jgi:hypothetical protein